MQTRILGSVMLFGLVAGLTGFPGAGFLQAAFLQPAFANEPWRDGNTPSAPAESLPQYQPPRVVNIDQLLKLPNSYRADDVRKGDLTRQEWRALFDEARSHLEETEKNLARVRAELKQLAGNSSQWNVTPPGADVNNANNPTNFRLTQELRRGREDVIDAEKKLIELDIEANLANVPEGWRL